jgi:hypothetical protein
MATSWSIPKFWLTIFLLTLLVSIASAQSPSTPAPLSVEEVVKMSQDGISEDVIIARIKKNGKAFDLSTEEILELKKSGVSDNVTKYLLDPSQPYAPPAATSPGQPGPSATPPPKPAAPARKYPEDPYALKVPPEPGLYHFQQNIPVRIDIKMVLGEKSGGGLGKVLAKAKITGYLVGPASTARVADAAPVFYVRLPEGNKIEELVLVSLDKKKDRREIDMGPPGPKPELKPDAMRQFDPLEVGPGLFRLTVGKLGKGEYLFFLIGSAEPPKGNYGKGYDFGIDLPAAAAKH